VLRTAGLRAEHVTFSFMKRRVQPLMRHDSHTYKYTEKDDPSRLHDEEISDELIIERLGKIFKDMPPYTSCPVPEYSASRPPKKVSSHGLSPRVPIEGVVVLMLVVIYCRRMSRS
jgi:hypothetical protein